MASAHSLGVLYQELSCVRISFKLALIDSTSLEVFLELDLLVELFKVELIEHVQDRLYFVFSFLFIALVLVFVLEIILKHLLIFQQNRNCLQLLVKHSTEGVVVAPLVFQND